LVPPDELWMVNVLFFLGALSPPSKKEAVSSKSYEASDILIYSTKQKKIAPQRDAST
jgi:hypothetical protein